MLFAAFIFALCVLGSSRGQEVDETEVQPTVIVFDETTEVQPTVDEADATSDPVSSDGSCVLPDPSQNRNYSLCTASNSGGVDCLAVPGQPVPNSQRLTITCEPGYQLIGLSTAATVTCNSGRWSRAFPECIMCGVALPQKISVSSAYSYDQQGFPWSASIFLQDKDTGTWTGHCLGTLISPDYVLTDTQCIKDSVVKRIKVGLDVYKKSLYNHHLKIEVKELVYRPIDSGTKLELALLHLAESVKIKDNVMPACVDWDNTLKLTASSNLHVSAWIRDQDLFIGKGKYIHWSVCKQQRLVDAMYTVGNDIFCARVSGIGGNPGKDSYGMGTTVLKDGKHYLVGVFNHGAGKAVNVYTALTSPNNMDWLVQSLGVSDTIAQTTQAPTEATTTVTTAPIRDPCTVPNPLGNRVFTKYNCQNSQASCSLSSKDLVSTGELVAVSCMTGYNLVQGLSSVVSRVFISCQHGTWDPKLPKCYKLCSPLTSHTLDLECKQGLNPVSCDKPMLPNTIATYKCKPFYESTETHERYRIKCNSDGLWSRELPSCRQNCGISNLNSAVIQPAIVGGNFSKPGNFPWHTALYYREGSSWEFKCGGTLISTKHVLTAAHCVTTVCLNCKAPVKEAEDVMVAFGKNYRDWDDKEVTEVTRKIKEIIIHPYYVGQTINYINDIAVMVLESDVILNSYVMPACVEFRMRHLEQLRLDKTKQGYVAGWGNTEECTSYGQICHTSSKTLKYCKTSIVDFDECYSITQHIKTFSQSRLTPDKFCSGNGSESVVQQGDSGGGMTFVFDGLHHIYGVVSVKVKMQTKEKLYYSFGAFSNVSYHLDWLNSILY